jgi:pimeloyl-ACP methyl ester carboxylesterase
VFRGRGAVFDPTIGLSRGVFRVRVTGGHHAKSALKYLFAEGHEVIKQWLPQAEEWVVPQATHGLQCMNPSAVADGLADFLARHT